MGGEIRIKLKIIFMKKIIIAFICMALFSACHQSKSDIVKDYIDVTNSYDTDKKSQFLSEDFMYYGTDTLNKHDYLNVDSSAHFEYFEQKSTILNIQDLDSIVKTEEKITTIVDSLLEITPYILKMTYRFSDDKLKSITVDSILNGEEYLKAFEEKWAPCYFYIQDQYDIQEEELYKNIKKYLTEYITLPVSERKQYSTYAHLQGAFTSNDCHLYKALIFRGKKTVTIIDGFFGFPFATSYEVDENYIRIRTDKSDLLFEIKDSETLIGEGFAHGTFTKSN